MIIPNLLSDGSFEDWTTATNLADWTEAIAGTSTVDQDTADERTSTDCLKLTVDASGSNAEVSQTVSVTINKFYEITVWAKVSSTTSTPALPPQGAHRRAPPDDPRQPAPPRRGSLPPPVPF